MLAKKDRYAENVLRSGHTVEEPSAGRLESLSKAELGERAAAPPDSKIVRVLVGVVPKQVASDRQKDVRSIVAGRLNRLRTASIHAS